MPENHRSRSASTPPTGATSCSRPPRGGLPDTSASGRGASLPSKSTASGRVTLIASSDPVCAPPRNDRISTAPREGVEITHGQRVSQSEKPVLSARNHRSRSASTPPTGATSCSRPPRGDLPDTSASGRGASFASVPDGFVHLMPCVAARRSQHISFFSFKPAFSAKALKVSPSCSIAHRKLRTEFCWRSVFAGFGVRRDFLCCELGLSFTVCVSHSDVSATCQHPRKRPTENPSGPKP